MGNLKNQVEYGQVQCHSLLGQAGQLLSPNMTQKCQQAEQYAPILSIGYFVGIAFGIIGFVIAIAGEDKCFRDKGTGSGFSIEAITNQILRLPEEQFWKLVSIRLNVPLSETNRKELGAEDREYWSWNYLVQEIFLQIASLRVLVTHNGKQISIYKYYSQALSLKKWIPIAKPQVEFVINASDLTVRILAELKALGPKESQQVLKLVVVQIFENIVGPRYTHGSIVRNLSVRLDK